MKGGLAPKEREARRKEKEDEEVDGLEGRSVSYIAFVLNYIF